MADISQTNWTEVDAQNNYAAPLGWTPGAMLPSQVEPTAQMMMGALKRFWNRANPIYSAITSITDVYTATPNVPITSLTAFEEFHVRFSGPNLTTSPAFVFANTPQQNIKKYSMSSLTALSPGDIQGHAHRLYWDNTQMILANPTSGSGSPFPPTVTVTATTGTFVSGGPAYSVGVSLPSNSVSNTLLTQMAANTIKGNNTGSTANAADLTVAQTGSLLSLGNRNFLIGGDFTTNPWQRGTSFAGLAVTTTYTADRWVYGFGGVSSSFTISKAADAPSGFLNSLKWQRLAANTDTTAVWVGQAIVSANSYALQGQPVTLSFWAKAGANFSPTSGNLLINVVTGTGVDQGWTGSVAVTWTGYATPISLNQAITASWVRYQFTATLGASVSEVAVNFSFAPTGTAGANDWVEIAGVQLEIGSVATAFEQRPAAEVLQLARYYYRKTFPIGTAPAQNAGVAGAVCIKNPIALGDPAEWVPFDPMMRATPTVTTYNPSAANANWRDITAAADVTVSVDPASALATSGVLLATSGTVSTLGDILAIHYTASAEL